MKTSLICFIVAVCAPRLVLAAPPSTYIASSMVDATVAAKNKVEAAQIATVIVNGKEFKLLIVKNGDKEILCEAVKKTGLKTADKEDSKAARKVGWEIMSACLKGNFVLVEPSPSAGR